MTSLSPALARGKYLCVCSVHLCMSTGRTQPTFSDPVAAMAGRRGWACPGGALGPTGVAACARAVGKEGGGPGSLGVQAAHRAAGLQALAGSRPDCGWQGALACRQLAVSSSPDHHSAHHCPPWAQSSGWTQGRWWLPCVSREGVSGVPGIRPQPCSGSVPRATCLTSLSLSLRSKVKM